MSPKATWVDHEREPRCQPDPRYPDGIDIDVSKGAAETCETELPYPAKRCGVFHVICDRCNIYVAVTTAGRSDDPRSLRVACKRKFDA